MTNVTPPWSVACVSCQNANAFWCHERRIVQHRLVLRRHTRADVLRPRDRHSASVGCLVLPCGLGHLEGCPALLARPAAVLPPPARFLANVSWRARKSLCGTVSSTNCPDFQAVFAVVIVQVVFQVRHRVRGSFTNQNPSKG